MDGSRALAQVEANGMRVDVDYLDTMIEKTAVKIKEMEDRLKEQDIWKEWKKIYGPDASIGSRDQLGKVVFEAMGVKSNKKTSAGKYSTDEEALEQIDHPFLKSWCEVEKLRKARSTNLIGLRREQFGGILRPSYNLNTTITYRSSASDPNSQNLPIRDKRLARLVRTAFIPRSKDHILVEIDAKGAEVRVATCYHQDPTMIQYIRDNHDFHKDLAMQCYMLEADQVSGGARGTAKGGFVFASFYGDWYIQISKNLWNAIELDHLTRKDGTSLREHLNSKGLRELGLPEEGSKERNPKPGSFGEHILNVYNDFWGRRFAVYSKWKEEWWQEYLRNGYYQTLTGFVCRGVFERNKAINYPIQGSSFHCLLWALIQINDWLQKNRMKSMIIGQIHDSIILDIHKDEHEEVLGKCHEVMMHDIRKAWPWIIVPLDVEVSASDENWYKKQTINFTAA